MVDDLWNRQIFLAGEMTDNTRACALCISVILSHCCNNALLLQCLCSHFCC
jgi:hypothetical protein